MPDPFALVQSGQEFPADAETVNGWQLAGRDATRRRNGFNGGRFGLGPFTQSVSVLVQNKTLTDWDAYGVVTLGEPIQSAVDNPATVLAEAVFAGSIPASSEEDFAILVEPIASGSVGLAVVLGVAVCDVDVAAGWHTRAVPIPGDATKLVTAQSGSARIIWRSPGDSGTKRAVVLIGQDDFGGFDSSSSGSGGSVRIVTEVECTSGGLSVDHGNLQVEVQQNNRWVPARVRITPSS